MHHRLNGHEFEQNLGDRQRQGNLVRCSLWGRKELDMILQLNNNCLYVCVCVYIYIYMAFPVVMYRCESWTIKRAERRRIDAFELWRILLSPLDCKEIQPVHPKGDQSCDQSWIFIGRTDIEAPIFDHLMQWADLLENTPMLGKIEGRRRRGW